MKDKIKQVAIDIHKDWLMELIFDKTTTIDDIKGLILKIKETAKAIETINEPEQKPKKPKYIYHTGGRAKRILDQHEIDQLKKLVKQKKRVEDIAKEMGFSRSKAYELINEMRLKWKMKIMFANIAVNLSVDG